MKPFSMFGRRFRADRNKTDSSPWAAVSVIRPYLRRNVGRILFGFLALMAVDLLQLWIPRIIKDAVDDLQHGVATSSGLLRYGAYIVLLALLIALLRFVWRHLLLGFSRLLETQLRNRMLSHLLTLDRTFFQRNPPGTIMALATNDLSAVQMATGMGMVAAVDAIFMGLAAIGFMAYMNWRLTAIAVAPMPILAILTRFLSSRLHRRFKRVQEQFSRLTEYARSSFSSIHLIKAYNQELPQAARFDQLGEEYVRDNVRLAAVHGTLFPLSGLIGNVGLLLVVYFGGRMTIQGVLSAGDFVAFITYLFMMTWPMMALGWVADLFQRGVTSLHRIQGLLTATPALQAPGNLIAPPITTAHVRIRNLSFSYPGQREAALENFSVDIRPGRFLGVVGRTGAGKTTLCHLLARLYPVPDRSIFINDWDVNQLDLTTVRGRSLMCPRT